MASGIAFDLKTAKADSHEYVDLMLASSHQNENSWKRLLEAVVDSLNCFENNSISRMK